VLQSADTVNVDLDLIEIINCADAKACAQNTDTEACFANINKALLTKWFQTYLDIMLIISLIIDFFQKNVDNWFYPILQSANCFWQTFIAHLYAVG